MRLALRTDLALRTLMACAARAPKTLKTADVARISNASFHHVAQVVNRLEAAGFLTTLRGRNGGITLARAASSIRLGAVVAEFEGEPAVVECFKPETNTCPFLGACRARCLIQRAFASFFETLDSVTLEDLVKDNDGLLARISLKPSAT